MVPTRTRHAPLAFLTALIAAAIFPMRLRRPKPPVGRWQGVYEGNDLMIAARLEIRPDGSIRISAPDALSDDFAAMTAADREVVRDKLATNLASSWPSVEPRDFKFDGKTFRKPDGVAPQMEWDDKTHSMTVIVYPGTRASVRMRLNPVDAFSDAS